MSGPVFLGNEFAGAGFRLAGLTTHSCEPETAGELFEQLVATRPSLLLVGESYVPAIGEKRVRDAVTSAYPLVLVVNDTPRGSLEDLLSDQIRLELGVLR